jgi:hypothetical protein
VTIPERRHNAASSARFFCPLQVAVRAALLFCFMAALAPALPAGEKPKSAGKAKADYALIFGTVWGADSLPVQGVRVKIRRADQKKARWELVSDRRGEFAQRVPAGTADYVVWAEPAGKKGPKAETKVHIDNDERADIGLHLAE